MENHFAKVKSSQYSLMVCKYKGKYYRLYIERYEDTITGAVFVHDDLKTFGGRGKSKMCVIIGDSFRPASHDYTDDLAQVMSDFWYSESKKIIHESLVEIPIL